MALGRDEEPLGGGARRLELELPRALEVGCVDDGHVDALDVFDCDQVVYLALSVCRCEVVNSVDRAENLAMVCYDV